MQHQFAGGSPAAGTFLLRGQKKGTKEKAALPRCPCGVPSVPRPTGRLAQLALAAHTKRALLRNSNSARRFSRSGCGTRRLRKGFNTVATHHHRRQSRSYWMFSYAALTQPNRLAVSLRGLTPLCAAEDRAEKAGKWASTVRVPSGKAARSSCAAPLVSGLSREL